MTRMANARIAGATFLIYIAGGITSMVVSSRATGGEGIAAKLVTMAEHPTDMGIVVLLALLQAFSALVLAVTLYAITRDADGDLAMLGLVCRVAEGVVGGLSVPSVLALSWLATATGTNAPDPAAAQALGAYLLRGNAALPATFFAVGSTCFAYLFLRGRMIPAWLAWLGVVASALLVVTLPLQLAGFLRGMIVQLVWLPMLVFEVPLALWLLVKGVAAPSGTLSQRVGK